MVGSIGAAIDIECPIRSHRPAAPREELRRSRIKARQREPARVAGQEGGGALPACAMQIIVTRVSGRSAGRQLTVDVEGDWTVDKLKAEIEKDHGIPAGTQLITFNAVKLLTGTKLRDYKIHLEAALQLAERPAGGGRHEIGRAHV